MRISAIKKELDERGVGYRGLFEKTEFVDLLIDARAKGITAPPPADADADTDEGGRGTEGTGANTNKDAFDPSYKEVEVCVPHVRGADNGREAVLFCCQPVVRSLHGCHRRAC